MHPTIWMCQWYGVFSKHTLTHTSISTVDRLHCLHAGPVVSQLLLNDFVIGTIRVAPKQTTLEPGMDYMTIVQNCLDV